MTDELDLVSKLEPDVRSRREFGLKCISPDDSKYGETSLKLADELSFHDEWMAAAYVQRTLLETRVEFGQAEQRHLEEVDTALEKISPLNMILIEEQITRHDQLAVIEEIGRYVSPETKALLHPGTTSYDILDTARSFLFRKAWNEKIRPVICEGIEKICKFAEGTMDVLQVGRTHLQNTSPVPFGVTLAGYARRLAQRVDLCDSYFKNLRGTITGMVGTGGGIDMVVGEPSRFELEVLKKLDLEPDFAATQIVQKEVLADVGHGITTMMHVLKDFADDMRKMYSSAIGEVTSSTAAGTLGLSSADASKNNPIQWENIVGKTAVVEGGMRVLYEMISSDFQRDLTSSVQARYQPQLMLVESYESFSRLSKSLDSLSVIEDAMEENLQAVRDNPSEAMTAILRGEQWIHSEYGIGHDFVKKMSVTAKKEGKNLLEVCRGDSEFEQVYQKLHPTKQKILNGELELYIGECKDRGKANINYARNVAA